MITILVENDHSEFLVAQGDSGGALINPFTNALIGIGSTTSSDLYQNGRWYGFEGKFAPFKTPAENYGVKLYTSDSPSLISQ